MSGILSRIYRSVQPRLRGYGLGKLDGLAKLNQQLINSLKAEQAEVLGHRMILDAADSLELSVMGIYEPFNTEVTTKLVQPGNVVVDIGANIGYYTLLFARSAGPDGRVVAFEPDPTNFEICRQNVELNEYANVELHNKAVSDDNDPLKLYLCDDNRGMHRIYASKYAGEPIDIEAIPLDQLLGPDAKVDYVKIDIEGAEIKALRGMTGILKSNERIQLQTEFVPSAIAEFGTAPEEYVSFLEDEMGFEIYDLDSREEKVSRLTGAELLEKYRPGDLADYGAIYTHCTNLLCTRGGLPKALA